MTDSFRENTLICGDPARSNLNACVGENGGPYDNYDFAMGYIEAAGAIYKGVIDWTIPVDLAVHPMCLMFRHGIELYLKYLPRVLEKNLGGDSSIAKGMQPKAGTHGLARLWTVAEHDLLKAGDAVSTRDERSYVSTVVSCFDEIDERGDVFRYPESIKREPYLTDWSVINVAVLEEHRQRFHDVVKRWTYNITGSA